MHRFPWGPFLFPKRLSVEIIGDQPVRSEIGNNALAVGSGCGRGRIVGAHVAVDPFDLFCRSFTFPQDVSRSAVQAKSSKFLIVRPKSRDEDAIAPNAGRGMSDWQLAFPAQTLGGAELDG